MTISKAVWLAFNKSLLTNIGSWVFCSRSYISLAFGCRQVKQRTHYTYSLTAGIPAIIAEKKPRPQVLHSSALLSFSIFLARVMCQADSACTYVHILTTSPRAEDLLAVVTPGS